MDLKTFVEETLCQIAEGIQGAQKRLEGTGAIINPYYLDKGTGKERLAKPVDGFEQIHMQTVSFDIALTASKTGKGGGGFEVSVFSANLNAGAHKESSDSSVSRVRFEVVVDLPHQKSGLR